MKRMVILAVCMCVLTGFVFAQNYVVESVSGRVQRVEGNSRVNIAVGDTLTADTVINTGVGASVVLKSGNNTFTVPASRNGKVSELISSTSRVRIRGNVSRTDTDAVSSNVTQVTTASARASDAAEDEDLAAEDDN